MLKRYEECAYCGAPNFSRRYCWDCKRPLDQAQRVFSVEKTEGGEMLKLTDMEKIAATAKMGADEIPAEFTGFVKNIQAQVDEYQRQCLNFDIDIEGAGLACVKYTPMHLKELVKAFKALGIENEDEIIGERFAFKKMHFNIGFDRPIPVARA